MAPEALRLAYSLGCEEERSLSTAALAGLMKAVLDKDSLFRFRATGTSMAPFIVNGDVISLASLREGSGATGDVVACFRPASGRLIVHRVVAQRRSVCLLRGGGLPAGDDGWIPREDVLGRVVRVERNGRRVRFGLGPEKWLIAALSRARLLLLLQRCLWPLSGLLRRLLG